MAEAEIISLELRRRRNELIAQHALGLWLKWMLESPWPPAEFNFRASDFPPETPQKCIVSDCQVIDFTRAPDHF